MEYLFLNLLGQPGKHLINIGPILGGDLQKLNPKLTRQLLPLPLGDLPLTRSQIRLIPDNNLTDLRRRMVIDLLDPVFYFTA